ncbi:RNA-directed DNA polymerase from mobile element jockey [Amphibalanus amphitrite]|uniref:RNA-directed DNA polymerase from mobile element jockey n=1 Tax=Amphibalanus amphitrite TaxID=1232801 RepID=A0A6A4XFQ2_AMPAM|nr:RNA-directed DNA polymerase from mobile element jockey [Amphibalanus amphitrite]
MDRREVTLLCLLDCSRCFDSIPHHSLLRKLELYGVDTRWFQSYLADHYQRVQVQSTGTSIDRTLSSPLMNPIGTYQGSALGPLLYNIYSNDLPLHVDGGPTEMIAYADDVQLFVTGQPSELAQLVGSLEEALSVAHDWYSKNGLKINAAKTQFIVLGSREMTRRIPSVSIKFAGSTITCSDAVKNLGVWFERDMTFVTHTNDVIRRCTGTLCGLSHSRHSLPQSVMATMVQGLVFSVIRYCLSVYGASNATQRGRLQKVIRFAARVVSGRKKFDRLDGAMEATFSERRHLIIKRKIPMATIRRR